MATQTDKTLTKLDVGAVGSSTPLSKGDKRVATSPLDTADVDSKKLRQFSGGSLPPLMDDGEPTTIGRSANLLSEPMVPSDIVKIAAELHALMLPEMAALITNQLPDIKKIVTESTDTLSAEIRALRNENAQLRSDNAKLRQDLDNLSKRVDKAESDNDALEQYQRRNIVRISGVPETEGENTDEFVIKLADELSADMSPSDIDRSHRVGKPKTGGPKPRHRDIIVKFTSYNARQRLYLKRKNLRESMNRDMNRIFINEDLTKPRSKLLYDSRSLVRVKLLKNAYSTDGKIFVRDNNDERHMIKTCSDILKFGDPDEARRRLTTVAGSRGPLNVGTE
ncbi:MAG: septum formation initiator family protein [Candidatus Thiodiazotropha endolucinida]|nr:septum formation initiator family protein [Candidatus Thiodiazotropha taylori]MCW4347106.1 septum formation initiator family protein [Candidatus Thiodiazotropha endolucinida]